MLIMEVARPAGSRFAKALVGTIVASSVSFGIYFAIAGSVFLDAYQVPPYSSRIGSCWPGCRSVCSPPSRDAAGRVRAAGDRLFGRLKLPDIVEIHARRCVFGLVGVALPLTLFTGSDQLKSVLDDAGTLGLGLLVALLIAKISPSR